MPEFSHLYLGDVLWGMMFFLIYRLVWPQRTLLAWAAATLTTELIEISQRYQATWLVEFRATPLGGLLLGHSFAWSDVVGVAIGAALAACLASASSRRSSAGVAVG